MRQLWIAIAVAACSSKPPPLAPPAKPPIAVQRSPMPLAADTPAVTRTGNTLLAPAGWTVEVHGDATVLSPPEPGNHVVTIDVAADSADAAVAVAWKAYKPDHAWRQLAVRTGADRDGWSHRTAFDYETSPDERRSVSAYAWSANGGWTVTIVDLETAVLEKRGAQIDTIFGRFLANGYARETFAGKPAAKLDAARVAQLVTFVERSAHELGVPGVALGLVQDGKVVYAGGVGVRELGGTKQVDGDTLFMIASNTKALTTLLLAKLVEENQLTWETPVTQLMPMFALGDAETTRQVLVKHLICACTGMPRQDLEWVYEFKSATPALIVASLATMHPTSKFGEMYQYSNPMAAAAGYVAGHVAYPALELGAAYDQAMQARVFDPLGMTATTFDFARAMRGNHAMPAAPALDGKPAPVVHELNYAIIPIRPAGGAWSSVRDMLRYVQMELAEGTLPDGKPYIAKEPLLARVAPQVAVSTDETYGMGLIVDRTYGIRVVHHGGDLPGFHSDMIWLPDVGVGAVVLTNGDPGWLIRDLFARKLLEVVFDGHPEADARIAAAGKAYVTSLAADAKRTTVPAEPSEAGKLAAHYHSDALGDLAVTHAGGKTYFDVGEFKSEVGSRRNPDGSTSFVLLAPGFHRDILVGSVNGKRTLIERDAQHEYVFEQQ